MSIYPELLVKKCHVSADVYEEFQKLSQVVDKDSNTVIISSLPNDVDKAFTLALLHCLNTEKSFDQLLCVYESEEQRAAWSFIASSMSKCIRVHCVSDEDSQSLVFFNSHVNVVFVKRARLISYFKHAHALQDVVPFVDEDSAIYERLSNIDVVAADVRCVNTMPFPLDYTKDEFTVYKFHWHALIYPSTTLQTDFVYDLNMVTTLRGSRICLLTDWRHDIDDGTRILDFHMYRRIVSTLATPIDDITDFVVRSKNPLPAVAEEDLDCMCKYHVLNQYVDTENNNCIVTLRRHEKQRREQQAPSSSSSQQQHRSPFSLLREIIDFNSSVKITRTPVNRESNYSMMLIYDQEMIDRLRKLSRKPGVVWRHSSSYLHTLTDVHNSRTKCTLIETFVMSQLDKQFYLLSPYISSSHPLCNFPNVRNLHPTDMRPAHALGEDATLIVFDAIFANSCHLDYLKCKCHVIFVVYQHTHEEEELQKFLIGAPSADDSFFSRSAYPVVNYIPFASSLPVRKFEERKLHLESSYRMAIAHFRTDAGRNIHTNLYPLLSRLLDITLSEVGRRYCQRSTEYTKIKYSTIPDLHRRLYVQRCVSVACLRFNVGSECIINEDDDMLDSPYSEEEEQDIYTEQRAILHDINVSNNILKVELQKQYAITADYLTSEDENIDNDPFGLRVSFNSHSLAYRNNIRLPPKIDSPSSIKELSCQDCNVVFKTNSGILRHLRSQAHKTRVHEHQAELEFACAICEQQFATSEQLSRHNISYSHTKRLLAFNMKMCGICKKIMNIRNYEEHVKSAHREDTPALSFYSHKQTHCTFCDFTTETPGALMDSHNESPPHMMRVTANETPFDDFFLHLNRHYLVFTVVHGFINDSAFADPCCYNILLESRCADLTTLSLIAACIRPTHRTFYRSFDNSVGFVSCSLTGITGIIGHYLACPLHTLRPCSCSYNARTIDLEHPMLDLLLDFIENEERDDGTTNIDYMPKNLLPFLRACLPSNKKIVCIEDIEISYLPTHERSYISLVVKTLLT